jgi:hypothetical protein
MFFSGLIAALVLALALTFVLVRRLIDPACPDCSRKEWMDVPRGIVCRGCGWSNLPRPVDAGKAIAA